MLSPLRLHNPHALTSEVAQPTCSLTSEVNSPHLAYLQVELHLTTIGCCLAMQLVTTNMHKKGTQYKGAWSLDHAITSALRRVSTNKRRLKILRVDMWCGVMEWCGVVWCGGVRFGVMGCGLVWCSVARCGGVVWGGVGWGSVEWCGVG